MGRIFDWFHTYADQCSPQTNILSINKKKNKKERIAKIRKKKERKKRKKEEYDRWCDMPAIQALRSELKE